MTIGRMIAGTTLAKSLSVVLMLGASITVARALGPEKKGVLSYLVLMASTSIIVTSLGFDSLWGYFLGRNEQSRERIFGTARTLSLAVGTAAMLMVLGWVVLDPRDTFKQHPVACLLLLAVPVTAALANTWRALLFGILRLGAANMGDLVARALYLGAAVTLAWLGGLDILAAVALTIVVHGAAALCFMIALPPRRWPWRDREMLAKATGFARWAYLASVSTYLLYRLDQALIIWMIGEAELGLYSIAVVASEQLLLVSQASQIVNLPLTAGRAAADEGHTPMLLRLNLGMLVFTAALLALAAPWLVPLCFGADFAGSVPMLVALLPGVVFLGGARVLSSDLAGRGLIRQNSWRSVTALVANLALNLLFIPRWGGTGAAVATSIAYLLAFLLLLRDYRRVAPQNGLWRLLIPRQDDFRLAWRSLQRRASGPSPGGHTGATEREQQ